MPKALLIFLLSVVAFAQTVSNPPGSSGGGGGGTGDIEGVSVACGVAGGGGSGSVTVRTSSVQNAQTGTTYTVIDGDCGKFVTLNNASAVAVTLPQANGSTFISGWHSNFINLGAGTVTITPTTSTVDGAASITLGTNKGIEIFSNGTNYFTNRGRPTLVSGDIPNNAADTSGTAAQATTALAGDSATAFFPSGTLESARLAADVVLEGQANTFTSGLQDFSAVSLKIPSSTSLPGTCAVGEVYMDTNATSGQRFYLCESTNTWALQGDGGGGGATIPSTTSALKGDGAGNAAAVTGTGSDCVHVDGTSAACPGGGLAGPMSSTDKALPRWSGTGGDTLQDSGVVVDDSNNVSIPGELSVGDGMAPTRFTLSCGTAPSTPSADKVVAYCTGDVPGFKTDAGTVLVPVVPDTGASNNFLTAISAGGVISKAQPSISSLSDAASVVTPSASNTLTNKTIDVEGTGNTITTVSKLWFDAAACSGTTGALNWDTLASGAPTATCSAGGTNTNLIRGVADFADSGTFQMMRQVRLPADFTGTVDVALKWRTTATSGNVVWQVSTVCIADAEVDDANWNTASTVTDAAKGTTNQSNDAAITTLTITGCAAGELMHFRILRDPTDGSDTLGATASLIGVELTTRRAQ